MVASQHIYGWFTWGLTVWSGIGLLPGGLTKCCPSVLWHFWLGHLTCKIVPNITYNVFGGTLNPTLLLSTTIALHIHVIQSLKSFSDSGSLYCTAVQQVNDVTYVLLCALLLSVILRYWWVCRLFWLGVDGQPPGSDAYSTEQSICSADDVQSRPHAPAHVNKPSALWSYGGDWWPQFLVSCSVFLW